LCLLEHVLNIELITGVHGALLILVPAPRGQTAPDGLVRRNPCTSARWFRNRL
jgi:hypothetical protein